MRQNTERPVTVDVGSNTLCGSDPETIIDTASSILDGQIKSCSIPELWDGKAAYRIANVLKEKLFEDVTAKMTEQKIPVA